MSYLYSPYDIAIFLSLAEFTQSRERFVIRDIWAHNSNSIMEKYRDDEVMFRRRVYFELSKLDGVLCDHDFDELDILMRGAEEAFAVHKTVYERSVLESLLKVVKLELTYIDGLNHRRIKLRRLLTKLGYKRRSAQLVTSIRYALSVLKLKLFLKNYAPCDIAEIDIDDVITIRLKDKNTRDESIDSVTM